MKKTQPLPTIIDIAKVEARLPQKKKRSHHEVVRLKYVNKSFTTGINKTHVLKDIDLVLYSGEFVMIYGPSGCGKSTLLHTIIGLEPPDEGEVFLRGINLYQLSSDERANLRRQKIGMVFQQANWIKSLTVGENVAYPLWLSGMDEKAAKKRAVEVLEEVGMEEFFDHQPLELSGGQQQRVALARALATDPWMIVADEPTGNLDTRSGEEIIEILARLNREKRRFILMVTHEINFLPVATRIIGIKDGRVVADEHY